MKNLRYLITVLALVNAGLVAQAAAAPRGTDSTAGSSASTSPSTSTTNGGKVFIGGE
ncbi:hypothetical protein [Deinococcus altitudinis]|uniref:hypothetical protein n=1 Tax=Deinococcus altitudinis TaxID=468914 RepID=UPI003891C954